jgi:hypothetical protein
MAGQPASHWKPSFTGKIFILAAMLATSIGTNTLNPQLALNPMPIATAVIISLSIS